MDQQAYRRRLSRLVAADGRIDAESDVAATSNISVSQALSQAGQRLWPLIFSIWFLLLILWNIWRHWALQPHSESPNELLFKFNGSLRVGNVSLIQFLHSANLLIRLTPLHGDPDLYVAYGDSCQRVNKLVLAAVPTGLSSHWLTLAWRHFILPNHDPIDWSKQPLFPLYSTSLGVDEVTVPQPQKKSESVIVAIYARPSAVEECRFYLEVFLAEQPFTDYNSLRARANVGTLSYDELVARFSTIHEPEQKKKTEKTNSDETNGDLNDEDSSPISNLFKNILDLILVLITGVLEALVSVIF